MTDANRNPPPVLTRCIFCGASSDQDPHEALKAMSRCTNCRLDIHLRGAWTGTAWRVTRALIERHGKARVAEAAWGVGP